MQRRILMGGLAATAVAAPFVSATRAQTPVTLNGAVQFNDDHAFTKALVKFEELVKKYYGKPVNFVLHQLLELQQRLVEGVVVVELDGPVQRQRRLGAHDERSGKR